ncbi:MAG: S49 family peptidase [Proteobacteria bacterium]|nr:S49 family peptidase [Pseudomonadota bacterium]
MRVDSPGGSAIASDQILDALKKAREAGKPVVVSMGTVAASGGYYISLAANRIFAHPGTLTGSIGVVWGKIAVGDSLALLGLRGAELSVGRNALFLSGLTPWDADQMAEVEAQADAIYEDFTRKVAEGRNMPLPEVLEIARGRVWTGADAQVRGLVDELGGFWAAVDHAKELAGIDPDVQVVFREFPRRRNLFGRLSDLLNISAGALAALHGLNTLLGSPPVQAVVDAMQATQGAGAQFRALGLPNP